MRLSDHRISKAWMERSLSPQESEVANMADSLLRMWAEWAKSSPLVRGLGNPSMENRTEIISDNKAMEVEDALRKLEGHDRLAIRDAYMKGRWPGEQRIMDFALLRFYDAYSG